MKYFIEKLVNKEFKKLILKIESDENLEISNDEDTQVS